MRIAVVGGGYAGMAAAAEITRRGARVTVFEAGKVLGGRARRVEVDGIALDNGLHILIGAYSETLRLIGLTRGPGEPQGLVRLPLELTVAPGFRLRAPRLPAPLHLGAALLFARGLSAAERLHAAKFMLAMRRRKFRLDSDTTVSRLLEQQAQPDGLSRLLWKPLCISALNTVPDEASAQVFLNVLRDSLDGRRADSDMLLPAMDFSALLPERAARFVREQGGEIRLGTTVRGIYPAGRGFQLQPDAGPFDRVIIATSPHRVGALLAALPQLEEVRRMLDAFSYQPIYSIYLQYPRGTRFPYRMAGLQGPCAQWMFDRGQLCGQDGLIGVVISASGAHQDLAQSELAQKVHAELLCIAPGLAPPLWHRVIAEKRATFSCTPDLARPENRTALPGLFLAGDYTRSDYPATLEGAVRSGIAAARLATQND